MTWPWSESTLKSGDGDLCHCRDRFGPDLSVARAVGAFDLPQSHLPNRGMFCSPGQCLRRGLPSNTHVSDHFAASLSATRSGTGALSLSQCSVPQRRVRSCIWGSFCVCGSLAVKVNGLALAVCSTV